MLKKMIYIGVLLLVLYLLYIIIVSNDKTEFYKVQKFTKINIQDSVLSEVYVVPSPPNNFNNFKKDVILFDLNCKRNNKYSIFYRLYIKERRRSLLDFFWGENSEGYLSSPPTEINDIDFLCKIKWYRLPNGQDTVIYKFYQGSLWFY